MSEYLNIQQSIIQYFQIFNGSYTILELSIGVIIVIFLFIKDQFCFIYIIYNFVTIFRMIFMLESLC